MPVLMGSGIAPTQILVTGIVTAGAIVGVAVVRKVKGTVGPTIGFINTFGGGRAEVPVLTGSGICSDSLRRRCAL